MTRDDLKTISTQRRVSIDVKLKESDKAKETERKADYSFIDSKNKEKHTIEASQGIMAQVQVKRLDKVD